MAVDGGGTPCTAPLKADERSRIKETPVDAEALLPDGPYDLWQENDEGRYANELVRAFARNPRLPKFLKTNIVVDTVVQGIDRGLFVAELSRHQIQGLAELVPELMEVSAGYKLQFRIQTVLDDAPEEVRTRVEQLIGDRLKGESTGG